MLRCLELRLIKYSFNEASFFIFFLQLIVQPVLDLFVGPNFIFMFKKLGPINYLWVSFYNFCLKVRSN